MLVHILPTTKNKVKFARYLRQCRQTSAEKRLWMQLRNRQLSGLKFRHQVPLGPFIADFLCVHAKLIVELDGDSHDHRIFYDRRRTLYFAVRGYRVIRFRNDQLYEDLEWVLEEITQQANKTINRNILPPPGRETEGGEQ